MLSKDLEEQLFLEDGLDRTERKQQTKWVQDHKKKNREQKINKERRNRHIDDQY